MQGGQNLETTVGRKPIWSWDLSSSAHKIEQDPKGLKSVGSVSLAQQTAFC